MPFSFCFFFLSCPLTFFPYSLLFSYLFLLHGLISFLLFPCASVWENTDFPISCTSFFAKRHDRNGRSVACQNRIILTGYICYFDAQNFQRKTSKAFKVKFSRQISLSKEVFLSKERLPFRRNITIFKERLIIICKTYVACKMI